MVSPEELAEAELLRVLPEPVLAELARRAIRLSFRAGEVLFHEGDPGDRIHVLREGEVEVVRSSGAGGVVLARCRRPDVFGELAVLTGEPRSATLVAATDGSTVTLTRSDLDHVFDRDPGAMRSMLAGLARSLTNAKESLLEQNQVLEQRVTERTLEVRETHLEVLRRLGEAVDSRDDATGAHIVRMSRMAAALAYFAGVPAHEAEMILRAAALHDIGKIAIPDDILHKPGGLDEAERELMKTHTTLGARLLTGSRSPVVQLAESIARSHHERWDGAGYPAGLSGEAIPLAARICAVVDVFDALISERRYKRAWSRVAALAEVEHASGTAFDPALVDVFARHFDAIQEAADERPDLAPPASELPRLGAHLHAV